MVWIELFEFYADAVELFDTDLVVVGDYCIFRYIVFGIAFEFIGEKCDYNTSCVFGEMLFCRTIE